MSETKVGRRERRRRRKEEEENQSENISEKTLENVELETHVTQKKLVRRNTYTVIHSKSDTSSENQDEKQTNANLQLQDENDSSESRNLTYSLSKNSNFTYNIASDAEKPHPIPAPRKWKSINLEPEKQSSDTDRDITEIDLDEVKSPKPVKDIITAPIPKPRQSIRSIPKSQSQSEKSVKESVKSPLNSPKSNTVKSETEEKPNETKSIDEHSQSELPIVQNIQDVVKLEEKEVLKKQKKILDLWEKKDKKKKSKKLPSFMRLEKKKTPKVSKSKETSGKEEKVPEKESEETYRTNEKVENLMDSPLYKESADNGRIYVQYKNGFHVREKKDILGIANENTDNEVSQGIMEDSTVKTAILFQKYWTRSMTYFHGILAGFGLSHATTITAIMLHFNYEPEGFLSIYSCLSLKIHYVFYALNALSVVSCFDRIDIGHMNKRHWEVAWKIPSMWIILIIYIVSLVLTFGNQKTEMAFDLFPDLNTTDLWSGQSQNEIQVSLLQWYHTVWTRDMLVLFAWLIISLTEFKDFLLSHITNMSKYAQIRDDQDMRQKPNYF